MKSGDGRRVVERKGTDSKDERRVVGRNRDGSREGG